MAQPRPISDLFTAELFKVNMLRKYPIVVNQQFGEYSEVALDKLGLFKLHIKVYLNWPPVRWSYFQKKTCIIMSPNFFCQTSSLRNLARDGRGKDIMALVRNSKPGNVERKKIINPLTRPPPTPLRPVTKLKVQFCFVSDTLCGQNDTANQEYARKKLYRADLLYLFDHRIRVSRMPR